MSVATLSQELIAGGVGAIIPNPIGFDFFDPAQEVVEIPVESEYFYWWQTWRPAHITVEFELATHRLAMSMWNEKKPWWVSI
mgnify:CR=1 FL=1